MRYAKVAIAALLGGLLPLLLGVMASPVRAQALSPGDIVRINPTTGAQTSVTSQGFFEFPLGIAVASNGDLLVANTAYGGTNDGVIRVNPTTGAQTPVSTGGLFVFPSDVAIGANGDL